MKFLNRFFKKSNGKLEEPIGSLSEPLPGWGSIENQAVAERLLQGGVDLSEIKTGEVLDVYTENRIYIIEKISEGEYLISGNPWYCLEPLIVHINGSNFDGSTLVMNFIGRGMFLEFQILNGEKIITSRILDVKMHEEEK